MRPLDRRQGAFLILRFALLGLALAPILPAPAQPIDGGAGQGAQHDGPGHVERIDWRHGDEALRKTYLDPRGRRKPDMKLPRIIVFDAEGRLLGGQSGFRTGDMRGLRRMVQQARPYQFAATLDDTREEAVMADGTPATDVPLAPADIHLVVFRADDCPRCDRLEDELARVVAGLLKHRFLWITIDSDPDRLDTIVPAGLERSE